jgi:branched-chain amino acid transport system ATP-binding protein
VLRPGRVSSSSSRTCSALDLSERGYILESGRVVLDGAADKLLSSSEVKRIFFGG